MDAKAHSTRNAGLDCPVGSSCFGGGYTYGDFGRIIGRPPGAQSTLEEDYLRVARRSRAATDQNFYQGRQD